MRLLLALALIFSSASANAERRVDPHWYIGLSGAISPANENDFSTTGVGSGIVEFDDGYATSLNLGFTEPSFTFGGNITLEYELSYGEQDIKNGTGSLSTLAAAVNYIYDPDLNLGGFSPYVGAGVGFAVVEADDSSNTLRGDDGLPIYQFMGGVEYTPDFIPSTSLFLGYKHTAGFTDANLRNGTGAKTKLEYDNQDIELGVKIHLN